MICRKCARIFDDSMSVCPDCGASVFGDERESSSVTEGSRVNMPYAAQNTNADSRFTSDERAGRKPVVITAVSVNRRNYSDVKSIPTEAYGIGATEKIKASDTNEKALKQSTGDKSAAILIVALVLILSVMAVFLTAVSVGSDIFRNEDEVVTTDFQELYGEEAGGQKQ